jgi:hypothetical protein
MCGPRGFTRFYETARLVMVDHRSAPCASGIVGVLDSSFLARVAGDDVAESFHTAIFRAVPASA